MKLAKPEDELKGSGITVISASHDQMVLAIDKRLSKVWDKVGCEDPAIAINWDTHRLYNGLNNLNNRPVLLPIPPWLNLIYPIDIDQFKSAFLNFCQAGMTKWRDQ